MQKLKVLWFLNFNEHLIQQRKEKNCKMRIKPHKYPSLLYTSSKENYFNLISIFLILKKFKHAVKTKAINIENLFPG